MTEQIMTDIGGGYVRIKAWHVLIGEGIAGPPPKAQPLPPRCPLERLMQERPPRWEPSMGGFFG